MLLSATLLQLQEHRAAASWFEPIRPWLPSVGFLLGCWVLGYLVSSVLVYKLEALFRKTETQLDDLVLAAIRRHLPIWFLLSGIAVGARFAPINESHHVLAEKVAIAGFFLSLTFAAASLVTGLLTHYGKSAGTALATTSLAQNIVRGVVLVTGALLILQNLGVEITPLITALGFGSFAIALGLQPTLADLFAGVRVTLGGMIRVGDVVQLESGARGVVSDIGWGTTRIKDINENLVAIPNGRLVGMIVINTNYPAPEVAFAIEVGVSYRSDLERVERITIEVGEALMKELPQGVATHKPVVRFHTFADSSVNYRVMLRAKGADVQGIVVHEFIKRLKSRFDREGIEIPFPQRVVHQQATK
ncbi:MAG: mechanosensitive ion channel family protein [Planctomycetes bacterium]|nr:mechanosensitive ion channel family protein [Planctomycetota bacterium]